MEPIHSQNGDSAYSSMTDREETLTTVNRSGFPFQFRVFDEIQRTSSLHKWSVSTWEHPWLNRPTETSGFVDLVLENTAVHTQRMVIECKRVRAQDKRQLQWVFLIPVGEAKPIRTASCLEIECQTQDRGIISDIRVWDNVDVIPDSPEAEICILPSDETRNKPILEHLASYVLDSVQGLAQEEVNIQTTQAGAGHLRRFIFPVIVTNATILLCQFNPRLINIKDGTLDDSSTTLTPVPFIRFRKSLSTRFPEGTFHSLAQANTARHRTVFIVNADSLPAFLKAWQMYPKGTFALERLVK